MFNRIFSKVRLAALAVVASSMVSGATAATVQFDELPEFLFGTPYVEANFKFTAGGQLGKYKKQALHLDHFASPYANLVKMQSVSGGLFSVLSLDLLPLKTLESFVGADTYVRFTGLLSGVAVGSVLAATQIGTNTIDFGTVFSNIDSFLIEARFNPKMDWLTDYGFDIDNIVAVRAEDPAPVPLPAAGLLMLGGLAALGALRRRRVTPVTRTLTEST